MELGIAVGAAGGFHHCPQRNLVEPSFGSAQHPLPRYSANYHEPGPAAVFLDADRLAPGNAEYSFLGQHVEPDFSPDRAGTCAAIGPSRTDDQLVVRVGNYCRRLVL